jgi:exopolyphosphatase/guanosine-5'-triphosphate,3'-diphosphate pyrophosphatase
MLGEAAGVPIRFLSGDEEADLMYAGIRGAIGAGDPLLALDLGGGSLELATGVGPAPSLVASAPIGAARLTGLHGTADRPEQEDRDAMETRIAEALDAPALARVLAADAEIVAACGGTVRTLARIDHLDEGSDERAPGSILRLEVLERLVDRLWSMSLEERLAVAGVAPRRAALLPAGSLVVLRTLERTSADHLTVSGWGLREGCLLEAAQREVA